MFTFLVLRYNLYFRTVNISQQAIIVNGACLVTMVTHAQVEKIVVDPVLALWPLNRISKKKHFVVSFSHYFCKTDLNLSIELLDSVQHVFLMMMVKQNVTRAKKVIWEGNAKGERCLLYYIIFLHLIWWIHNAFFNTVPFWYHFDIPKTYL